MRWHEPILEPVEQEVIPFHEHEIIAVRLADGRICVVLRWVCETLQLDPQGQVRRIERTASELVRVKATYHETMSLWHRWQADQHMQAWRKEMQLQQGTIVEEGKTMGNLLSNIQERMGPARITTEHQTLVQFYVSQLGDRTKKTHATIYAQLKNSAQSASL